MMKRIILFAAAFMALVACTKTEVNTPSFTKGQVVTITASSTLNDGTKVTGIFNDADSTVHFTWESGDKVLIKVGEDTAHFKLKTGEGTATATFEGVMPASGSFFDIQYPVEIPDLSEQYYSSSSAIPSGNMLFTASNCTLEGYADLKPRYALLKLNFYSSDWDELTPVDSIVLSYQLSGITDTTKLLMYPPVSLGYTEEDSKPFYIVVPAGITDVNATINGIFSLTLPSGIVFTEGNCIDMIACELRCLAAGTRITMSDGSVKKVEDVIEGDVVRTFDHEAGCISSQKVCLAYKGDTKVTPLNLTFASGKTLSIVGTHDLLFKDTLKYVRVNGFNVKSYIGKQFYNAQTGNWDELVNYTWGPEAVEYYCIYSAYHLNCIAEGMLTCPDDVDFLLNIYELDDNLKADNNQLAADIQQYGLWNFAEKYPEYIEFTELLDELQAKYIKISLEKGLVTKPQLYELLKYWEDK